MACNWSTTSAVWPAFVNSKPEMRATLPYDLWRAAPPGQTPVTVERPKPSEFHRIGALLNVDPKAARVTRILLLDRVRARKFMHKLLTMINVHLSTILYGVSRLGDPGWIEWGRFRASGVCADLQHCSSC